MKVFYHNLGVTDFAAVWKIQEQINKFKQKNHVNDIILTTQHNHVYTLGKSGDKNHLLISEKDLRKQNISYYEIDRGGDLTYHGPGQLVCYPIFDLKHYYEDAHRYLRDLEETVILTLKHFNIESSRDNDYTGVWVGDEKICAIGIKLSRWITMHGLALNVNNDLSYFGKIIPCGIFHKGVTRMQNYLKRPIEITEVEKVLLDKFKLVFNIEIEEANIDNIKTFYNVST
jgi:lipoyl(octanoyl) transferase